MTIRKIEGRSLLLEKRAQGPFQGINPGPLAVNHRSLCFAEKKRKEGGKEEERKGREDLCREIVISVYVSLSEYLILTSYILQPYGEQKCNGTGEQLWYTLSGELKCDCMEGNK